MLKSYLPPRFNSWAFIISILIWHFINYKWFIYFSVFYSIIYLILRKNRNDFRDDPVSTRGVIFSPCNGTVVHIEKNISHAIHGENLIEIQILIPWWKEMGIYLPLSCEIKNLIIHKGRSFFRYYKAHEVAGSNIRKGLSVSLDNRGETVGLTLYKCRLGMWPEVLVMPGDRGGRRVNIGYFPFGGTVMLYLPEKYEIMIKVNDKVSNSETIVAMLPDNI